MSLRVPPRYSVVSAPADRLLGVVTDSLDGQTFVMYGWPDV